MKEFRQLKVWEKAHQLALDVYQATKNFPKEELYGLTSQTRRASMSPAQAAVLGGVPAAKSIVLKPHTQVDGGCGISE